MIRSVMSFDVAGLAGAGFIPQPDVWTTAENVLQNGRGCVVLVNNSVINHENDGGSGCTNPLILYLLITHVPAALPPEQVTPLNCALLRRSYVTPRAGIDVGVNGKTDTAAGKRTSLLRSSRT
jgi:hypothetical protein